MNGGWLIEKWTFQEERLSKKETVSQYWTDDREFMPIYSSASQSRVGGVGLLVRKKLANSHRTTEKVSDRILKVYYEGNPLAAIYVVYAPTDVTNDSDKEAFVNDLHESLSKEQPHPAVVVFGDFYGRTGQTVTNKTLRLSGDTSYHDFTNDNGKRLVELSTRTRILDVQSRFSHRFGRQ